MNFKTVLISFILLFFIIGAVSASDLDSPDTLTDSNVKEIFVSDTGNDLNTGTIDSPYASIGKAITDVNASDDATIYLSKGTFSSDEDANFDINLNHKVYGGNLKFIGSGNETILDGQSTFRFAKLGENTNITFINLTFINFKGNNGGTLYSEGTLNIDNCIFKNSYSTGSSGGAIYSTSNSVQIIVEQSSEFCNLNIKNSQFLSCSVNMEGTDFKQGGGAIYANYLETLYLENNSFINTRIKDQCGGAAVLYESTLNRNSEVSLKSNKFINLTGFVDASIKISYSNATISDNVFINCSNPSNEFSIVNLGDGSYNFKNNSFINSSNDVGNIHVGNKISIFGCYIFPVNIIMDNQIVVGNYELNNGLDLNIKLMDDMGNIIDKNSFGLVFSNENNSYNYFASKNEDKFHIKFDEIPEIGSYNIYYRLTEDLTDNNTITTAKINYSYSPIDLWVSPNGHDGNNGSEINPFLTIQHAIDFGFEKSFNVVLHLMEGIYSGEDNVELNIDNKGSLQIIGMSNDNTIIDGNNENWFINVNTVVSIKNLKFTNGYSHNNDLISMGRGIVFNGDLYLENCIIDNCNANDNYVLKNVFFNNLNFSNNHGGILINVDKEDMTFNNSCFINNNNNYGLFVIKRSGVTISNSKFINNTAEDYAAAIVSNSLFTSKNNIYIDNSAPHDSLFSTYVGNFENDTYINNKATIGNFAIVGVQLESERYSNLTFKNCKFINNTAYKEGIIGIKQGSISNSSFINNTAEYGGAIVVYPVKYPTTISNNKYYRIEINDTIFKDNIAKVNGHDIYLKEKPNSYDKYKTDLIDLKINYVNKNVTGLYDILSVNISGPSNAIVGGGKFDLKLNNIIIGSCEIINGIINFEYDGFEDGIYLFDGDTLYSSENSTINTGTITVEQSQLSNICEIWISNNGDDMGSGDEKNPFKSISKAISYGKIKSRNILIHIGEGIYGNNLDTNLILSSMYNITLVGEGIGKTIICGDNSTYFAKINEGSNTILISNLTLSQMGVNGEIPSIIINSGSNLQLNNVRINKFNNFIENNGNLHIINSIFEKNLGLISGGTIVIDNTQILSCEGKILGNISINNSVIKDIVSSYGFELIGGKKCIIENTLISNDCNNESLNRWGISNETLSCNPAIIITSNFIDIHDVVIINNFSSKIKEYQNIYDNTVLSVFGYAYNQVERNVSCYNSSFSNFNYLWCVNTYPHVEFNFDCCVFNNISLIAQSQSPGEKSKFSISNSVFLNSGHAIDRRNRGNYNDPTCVFENNYWASNDKPVIHFVNPGRATSFEPKSWIVLKNVGGMLKFQLTDGVSTTDYDGNLPLSIDYALDNGEMIPVITVDGKSYPLTFEGNDIRVDSTPIENPVLKPAADNTLITNDLTLTYGDIVNFTARFLYPWGNPLANSNVTFTIEGRNYTALTDADGIANIEIAFDAGAYSIITVNPASGQTNINSIVVNKLQSVVSAANVNTVYNGGKYLIVTLKDSNGIALAGRDVTVVLNSKAIKGKTDANGQFKVSTNALAPKTYAAAITFAGDANHLSSKAAATVKVTKATPKLTAKKATLKNKKYTITLKDNQNKAMKKVKVTLKVKGKTYKATTNAKGKATFKITKLTKRGKYTAKVKFAGNKCYKAKSVKVKITVK